MKLQQLVEEKVGILIVFTLLVVSVGLLIEVVPRFSHLLLLSRLRG